ncbi:hypothetical protein [Pantoea sp. ACRSB]|uniref:hypothetical protein n=1 Tax=Pantoea sp. ACRSB TaxID=2918207 RepID=UPI002892CB66|nr:hypothetical protein [Pantoea sp. ACRSB]MCG7388772.1 hypothetical protein [Pantoea sp. ACRSB]
MLKAKSLAKFHLIAAFAWAVLTLPTLIWWKESILWVSLMSIYAIVVAKVAAYSAAHAEKEQERNG